MVKIYKQFNLSFKEMEAILLFSSDNATLKYEEIDDMEGGVIPSIDYEVELNDNGDYIGGDFIFEIDEALKAYGFTKVDELVAYCKQIIKDDTDVKQMWDKLKNDFEAHDIDVSPDEYEGGDNFMTNI